MQLRRFQGVLVLAGGSISFQPHGSFLSTISKPIEGKNLPALMIGGHAVTALVRAHKLSLDDPDFSLPSSNIGEKLPSDASKPRSLAEIDFPTGEGPKPHTARFLDLRKVEIARVPSGAEQKKQGPLLFP
jgi:hypothetical protein